jgi:hypothetical protein
MAGFKHLTIDHYLTFLLLGPRFCNCSDFINTNSLYRASHACYTELIVLTTSGMFTNGISDIDLTDGIRRNQDGSIRNTQESINYKHNTSTSIFKIISLLENEEEQIKKIYKF